MCVWSYIKVNEDAHILNVRCFCHLDFHFCLVMRLHGTILSSCGLRVELQKLIDR